MRNKYIHLMAMTLMMLICAFKQTYGQNLVVQGEMVIDDNLTVEKKVNLNGRIILNTSVMQITSDNQLLTISDTSAPYIRIGSNTAAASSRTLLLSNGVDVGQTIVLECACAAAAWELLDNPSPAGNVNLVSDRTFDKGNIIQLMWNGTDWLEVHFSDN